MVALVGRFVGGMTTWLYTRKSWCINRYRLLLILFTKDIHDQKISGTSMNSIYYEMKSIRSQYHHLTVDKSCQRICKCNKTILESPLSHTCIDSEHLILLSHLSVLLFTQERSDWSDTMRKDDSEKNSNQWLTRESHEHVKKDQFNYFMHCVMVKKSDSDLFKIQTRKNIQSNEKSQIRQNFRADSKSRSRLDYHKISMNHTSSGKKESGSSKSRTS